jgi:hypothetical protein
MSMKLFEISWNNSYAEGHPDLLPVSLFEFPLSGRPEYHDVRGPKGGTSRAQFLLTVGADWAELDYQQFPQFNEPRDMVLGVLRLEFRGTDRSEIKRLLWDGELVRQPQDAVVRLSDQPADASVAEIVENQKQVARQVVRLGQAAFRKKLERVYGSKCAISGCSVAWTLQAAHIRPFAKSGAAYDISNGLLLRSDLHLLFDAGLIAIEPTTHTIYFAHEIRQWPEYAAMHGSQLRLRDAKHSKAVPDPSALAVRWKAFQRGPGA